jgi:hypothetical protein
MTDDDCARLQVGFTSPEWRSFAFGTREPVRRRPIGFIHFGEPEPEPGEFVEEFIHAVLDRDDVI